jgi:GH24 family phage-related lysozyme (muramidase)
MSDPIVVPDDIVALLKLREGFKAVSYADTLGKLTGGYGHELSPREQALYPKGMRLPQTLTDGWFANDSSTAYQAAVLQASMIGVSDPVLIKALAAVSFQLGTDWRYKFVTLWTYLKDHEWENAALDAEGTLWAKESPTRVADFAAFVRSLILPPDNGDAN